MKTIFTFFIFLVNIFAFSNALASKDKILFEENKNQWPLQTKYRVGAGNGITLFMEKDKFTFVKYDPVELEKIHEQSHDKTNKNSLKEGIVHLHSFQMNFVGSNHTVEITAKNKASFYHNYFIGNDPSKWASEVGLYEKVNYKNIYTGIDLAAYQQEQNFKYDFIVGAGADPAQIKMEFNGAEKIAVINNQLVIKTSIGDVIENIPYTYQVINGIKQEVQCQYNLSSDSKTVSFYFPNGYDKSYTLIIDPVVVGSTYSGSSNSTTTYGHCATYDHAGNIYTGGECFNTGYPTTIGAFQTSYAGGVDIAISKLNPDASNLIWATYLGGSASEIPNSLFVPTNEEIYILGATSSSDYPTSASCFDTSFGGGRDIVITHLNSTGAALVGSTYIGGAQNDGGGFLPWAVNGHDAMRGEIIVDASGNAWIASFTNSVDFPTTPGAYDQTINGAGTFDACAFRLSPNLSALEWSTFIGGSGGEAAYGLRLNTAGELYITGGTTSNNFPTTVGAYNEVFTGGTLDGYITRFNATGTALLSSTFFGSTADDISYFIDMDGSGYAYVYGSTLGAIPITGGVYSNPGSGNFVSKFNPELTALTFSTVFGNGAIFNHLEPEAFMVDSCDNIYMSGFGSTSTYPVTPNALFSTPAAANNGNCYFIVLSRDAATLLYGSFYYGNHVDGGTSRFDPGGTIYQGICIGGGSATTPPWAWDTGVNPSSWDMFVFKIAFQFTGVNAIGAIAPNDTICSGTSVSFVNNGNGVNYLWDFGDGSPIDTTASPTHLFNTVGVFNVAFIAVDSLSCNIADTTYLSITVFNSPNVNLGNDTTICGNPNILLDAGTSGTIYTWSTGETTQTITATSRGTYWITLSNSECSVSDTIIIQTVTQPPLGIDTTLCDGQNLTLNASNPGATYLWSTGANTQTINPTTSGQYWVNASAGTCSETDTINVSFTTLPTVIVNNPTICNGQSATLTAIPSIPGGTYSWDPAGQTIQSIIVTPIVSAITTYTVNYTVNGCSTDEPVISTVTVNPIPTLTVNNETICSRQSATLIAMPSPVGGSYSWEPEGQATQHITVSPQIATTYTVTYTLNNCMQSAQAIIDICPDSIFIPNVFSPNGDGVNDVFTFPNWRYKKIHCQIYNRWGTKIYEWNNVNGEWDGQSTSGKPVPEGTYYYIMKAEKMTEGLIEQKGFLTLLRK